MLTTDRLAKIKKVTENRQSDLTVVLEDIHDPHNAEAVFRSCDAFGVQDVYLIFNREDYFNPSETGKSTSSSANKWLDFHIFKSTTDCLTSLKNQKFSIFATALTHSAKSIFETQFNEKKFALVFGNEHRGLSEEALKLADKSIIIPMSGMVQSLNLSVTAGIVLYEVTRQKTISNNLISYPPVKLKKLQKNFASR
jgi:tRNA (guanosine-2'-O-)-methyltransferase